MLTVQCPHCGSFNDDSATTCYLCKKELPVSPDREAKVKAASAANAARPTAGREKPGAAYSRPGCVSVYAVLTFLSGLMGIFLALYLPTLLAENPSILLDPSNFPRGANPVDPEFLSFARSFYTGYSIVLFLFSVLTFLIGWGLWTMRNWARIFILISQGFSLAAGMLGLLLSIVSTRGDLFFFGMYAVALVPPGIIFLWFLLNRRLFR